MTNAATGGGAKIRAVVPEANRWLSALVAALMKLEMPVEDAVLGDGALDISFDYGGPPLKITVVPTKPGQRAWRSTARFSVSYGGSGDLTPAQERHLRLFMKVLARFDEHMPERFKGFGTILVDPDLRRDAISVVERLFPFVTIERSDAAGGENCEVLIRTTTACNQKCPFCSGPTHDRPGDELIIECLETIAELLPGAMVSLTGGEPTLRKTFMREVRRALELEGIGRVQVQTNAVGFAERFDPAELPASPRLGFFVSLHATVEETYDACTGTTGQFADALAGVDRILAADHQVTLNTVLSTINIDRLEEHVARLPMGRGSRPPTVHFSALICPEYNPEAARYLVRFSELVPIVQRATRVAMDRGFEVDSLLTSTHATVPPCVVPAEERATGRAYIEESEAANSPDWVKAEQCGRCSQSHRCLGVSRSYAARFGFDELQPVPFE